MSSHTHLRHRPLLHWKLELDAVEDVRESLAVRLSVAEERAVRRAVHPRLGPRRDCDRAGDKLLRDGLETRLERRT